MTERYEDHPMLDKIGLPKLNERGYVNLESIHADSSFGYGKNRRLEAATWRAEQEGETVNSDVKQRIHPIFRWDNWRWEHELDESEWDELRPVLQLATLLLEDDAVLGFLSGLLDIDSHKRIHDAKLETRLDHEVYWFKKKDNPSNVDKRKVWKELYELSDNLKWYEQEMVGDRKNCHAFTRGRKGGVGIVLNELYINYVCRGYDPTENASEWTPGSDKASALLRVKLNLANTMVHEVMHALWRNKYAPKDEPFYMDTRVCELGFSWEKLIYSGLIDSCTNDKGSPYMNTIVEWPCATDSDEESRRHLALMSHKKWGGLDIKYEFAVDMNHVQNMFTHDFWAAIDRYGSAAFQPSRKLGIRLSEVAEYWENESPTIRGPGGESIPASDDADEDGIIDRR